MPTTEDVSVRAPEPVAPAPPEFLPVIRPEATEWQKFRETLTGKLREAIQNLYGEIWGSTNYDLQLRRAVQAILNSVGATGLLVQSRHLEVSLYCPAKPALYRPTHEEDNFRFREQLERAVNADAQTKTGYSGVNDGASEHIIILRVAHGRGFLSHTDGGPVMRAAILYRREDMHRQIGDTRSGSDLEILARSDTYDAQLLGSLLPILADAFRHHDRRFAAFPPRVIERYWEDAPRAADPTQPIDPSRPVLQPPWASGELVPTATLSIDLRKSTYCMEYARSERDFGDWLDQMVEKMRHIAHQHCGIFDKFTGDGALVHFLDQECREIYKQSAVDAAVHCAADMQRAVDIHMRVLRGFLHHDSVKFGAGIAIDTGPAFWSTDHRDNPIVVGKGVVGACRVGDKAPRGRIRFTNQAYHDVSEHLRGRLGPIVQEPLSTKETSDDLPLLCWEVRMEQVDPRVGKGVQAVEDMCNRVKTMFAFRRPKSM